MATVPSAFLNPLIPTKPSLCPCHKTGLLINRPTFVFPYHSSNEGVVQIKKTWRDVATLNYWVVRDYYRLVDSVNALEPRIQSLSDDQLRAKTDEFRQRLALGETLADIQAGQLVTVNDYLARRDAEWMGRVHRFLGLSVGLIQKGMMAEERRRNYRSDITYTNNTELGFDYLRDNLVGNSAELVMRWPKPFHFAIVDEVDSVLIDEGRSPLLISGQASEDAARYPVAAKVAELLVRGIHYNVEL